MTPLISVVVCTRNRSAWLRRVLGTLCAQTLDPSEFELIVIDNGSTDDTPAIADEFRRGYPNVRYSLEGEPGLSHARNRGWIASEGRYVAFIDDDCKAPDRWLSLARRIITTEEPGAFGGPILPFYEVDKPAWYKDSYATLRPGDEPGTLDPQKYSMIYGGNLFVQRRLLERVNGFDSELGMKGDQMGFGEETAVLKAISIDLGETLYYDPDLFVLHLVRPEKLKLGYCVQARFVGGRSAFRLTRRIEPVRRRSIFKRGARAAARLITDGVRGMVLRDRERFPYYENYLFERTFRYVGDLGWCFEAFGQTRQVRLSGSPDTSG